MTDNVVDDRRKWAGIRPGFDRGVAIACFGTACAIGLVFAFVGLETHSFSFDELFTARLLEPAEGTTLLSRIVTDVHPPLYLLALSFFTQLFGDGDAALRSFSAIFACGAILVFIATTRSAFSLPARLFGAAMATGSLFWFYQAQNARSYALGLLIGAGVMGLGLSLLLGRSRSRLLVPGLLALMVAGSFVHFYVMYVCLAVLIVLGLFKRRDRAVLGGAALFLLLATGLYVKLVMEHYSQVSLGNNWYQNNPAWYVSVLKSCVQYSLGDQGLVAFILCGVGILYSRLAPGGQPASAVTTCSPIHWFQSDPTTAFLVAVPLLVLAGGIVSSTVLAPNFWDRNFLVVSPFIWGLAARSPSSCSRCPRSSLRVCPRARVAPYTSPSANRRTGSNPCPLAGGRRCRWSPRTTRPGTNQTTRSSSMKAVMPGTCRVSHSRSSYSAGTSIERGSRAS